MAEEPRRRGSTHRIDARTRRSTAPAGAVAVAFVPPLALVEHTASTQADEPKPAQVQEMSGRAPAKRKRGARAAGSAPTARAGAITRVVTERPARAPRARRTAASPSERESNIVALGEPPRLIAEHQPVLPPADALFTTLPAMRHTLLNRPLDEAANALAEGLAAALAPAAVQVWIAEPAPWTSEQGRVGGLELLPLLRLRAAARVLGADDAPAAAAEGIADAGQSHVSTRPDPLIEEVLATRRPAVLFDADALPTAAEWVAALHDDTAVASGAVLTEDSSGTLGTLAAYPLRARGQFLGVLAVGTRWRLGARHLGTLEELADLAAVAADRDRLLSYSRSQEALAQTVVRHAPVAVAVLSGLNHTFALTNPTFTLLLGVEADTQLVGRRLSEVVPERAASLANALRLDAVYESGQTQAMIELPMHQRDRGMTYWNVTSSPLPGISRAVGGVLVAAVEVTRQVLARQRAQEVAEVAQERIGQMMTLHATSLAVASQLGADPRELLEDILRRSIALLNARAGTVYARAGRSGDLEVIVCQGLRGDYTGSRIRIGEGLAGRVAETGLGLIVDDYRAYPFRAAIYADEDFSAVIAVPLIHRGQVVGVLDVLDDAERRTFTDDDLWLLDLFAAQAAQAIENARTYVQLEHAYRKQRDLDRMKDDFIATASHELRTPLTGVQGFLELLQDYSGSRDDTLALDFLHRASESAQELAEIAERLLQTSRLDAGRVELHLGPVRLATVVEEALRAFRELQETQRAHFELSAEIPPDVYVIADLGRLKEVLDNLIGNAIKYSPRGGRIAVRCAPADASAPAAGEAAGQPAIEIAERPTVVLQTLAAAAPDPENDPLAPLPSLAAAIATGRYVQVTVRDKGMGIAKKEQAALFGRFARTDSARTSQIRGTGLGLYICRQIMRAMHGDVWLQASAPGRGSTFAFALPQASLPGADVDASALAPSEATDS
ncbi:MAG TPA: GAF domain-containing protein [Ktedonobacterales bacterium]|nr:GAF domain-containing protein [Ktedonobacterales bacterium]